MIYVKNMVTVNCSDDDGINRGIVGKISRKEWNEIGRLVKKLKGIIEHDYSNGGHGCILEFDYKKMYEKAVIIPSFPDSEVDNSFIDLLREDIE